jgi:hypothetical protein
MVHRVQVRPISDEEGNRLLRIVRRSSGSVMTWRRRRATFDIEAHCRTLGSPAPKDGTFAEHRPQRISTA